MPWQNNAGGPWQGGGGGGGRGPWGQGGGNRGGGGQGGGPQGPNLEDLIRKGQERLKQSFPSGNIGPKGLILAGLVVVGAWLATGIYTVDADEQGIVLQFGAYNRTTQPGINYHLPWPIESVLTPKVTRQNQLNVGVAQVDETGRQINRLEESLMLTGDEQIVDINFTVFWNIAVARDYLFNVADVDGTIKAVAESAMREAIGRNRMQAILTEQRGEIEEEVKQRMQATLDSYGAGVTVGSVRLQKADPPAEVIDAFRDVQAAAADKERLRNEAQRDAAQVTQRAEGEAAQVRNQAAAYQATAVSEAEGEAGRFLEIYEQYRLAPDVTRKRIYLETMERMLRGTNKIIVDDKSGAGQGVVSYLPLDQLRPNRAPAQGPAANQGAGGQ